MTNIINTICNLDLKDRLALILSSVSLFISAGLAVYFFIQKNWQERYKVGDDKLLEILKLNLEYPEFNNPMFTERYKSTDDKELLKRYDIYAMIVWNYLELLFDYYGEGKLKKTSFRGAVGYWSKLHYRWFCEPSNMEAYEKPFIYFVEKIVKEGF